MILSATMMLRHLALDYYADNIAQAAYKVIEEGKVRTPDMGGQSHTTDMTRAPLLVLSPFTFSVLMS